MRLPAALVLLLSAAPAALGQAQTCTQEMIASDDCAAVIDANACYNQFRWNAQTLQCIDGKDNTDRQRKASPFFFFFFPPKYPIPPSSPAPGTTRHWGPRSR
ncbi:putative cytoplasmic dynein 1 heavy chain [Rosellinia necatrix]|uniref:Putative cytoplasmic dynein 1 heavy chain n=1 Tax=Rosellinia necatrix TaxID=77044 RepID=A0A1S8A8Q2_ROSNE|nr:putative cytoplasmic dynein 1 heavy chain [Rosellinia necatrix]